MKPIIAITIGDFNGIGPELALKTAGAAAIRRICTPVLFGPLAVIEEIAKRLKLKTPIHRIVFPVIPALGIAVFDCGDAIAADITYGKPSKTSGKNAASAIEAAVHACYTGKAAAMVTAPVSKEALHSAGYHFPGQTEMIALLSRSQRHAMMLVSNKIRVGLLTIHLPISEVASSISKDKILDKLEIVHETLKFRYNIKHPKIALLALNPHAGENGVIGPEENSMYAEAIAEALKKEIVVEGPFPADGYFGTGKYKKYDATLASYHDQGLIPMKMLSFDSGVNYSAGLNVIRTSPDHGTAYDIAGKNKANAKSMIEAIKLAIKFATAKKPVPNKTER